MAIDFEKAFEEYGGKVFLVLGVIFVYAGLLTMSPTGTWQSAVIILLSVVFFLTGFAIQYEWFSSGIRSVETASAILTCTSIMLLAIAGVLFLFIDIKALDIVPSGSRRGGWNILIESTHPYAGISQILGLIGAVLFFAGFTLKLKSA